MAEWCRNRFEITGKSVCLDVLIQWIEGNDASRYRHAIQQSILLFLAGCAGILKPVRSGDISALSRAGQSRCRLNNCSQSGMGGRGA